MWGYSSISIHLYLSILRKHLLTEKVVRHLHKLLKKTGPSVQHGSHASVLGINRLDDMNFRRKKIFSLSFDDYHLCLNQNKQKAKIATTKSKQQKNKQTKNWSKFNIKWCFPLVEGIYRSLSKTFHTLLQKTLRDKSHPLFPCFYF